MKYHTPHCANTWPLGWRSARTAWLSALACWVVGVTGCWLPPVDLAEKSCPCSDGWVCDPELGRCVRPGELARQDGAAPMQPSDAKSGDAASPTPSRADAAVTEEAATPDARVMPEDAATAPGDGGPDADAAALPRCVGSVLQVGQRMMAGEHRCSPNGQFRFGLSAAGDLEFRHGTTLIWAAGICCSATKITMQNDGNLVVRDAKENPLFSSRTDGLPGAWLYVEDAGRAVIWHAGKAVWEAGIPVVASD